MLETCLQLCRECKEQAEELQKLARCITDRDYAAELLERESTAEREYERLGEAELARGGFAPGSRGVGFGRR
ncbi:MAG: hypothetical protein ACYC6L_12720 [Anaerolineae bacterium]